ncbi:TPR domain protein [Aspergillus bombycis]|uniref:TPR domain protein n=1 Tax=Aspergillus bombycis TaxID=109264 RepID=A0A1F8A2S2_9EURO|nr:TPR domain protein [Aspergillus bombycis]OGM45665.1 TPR domain protein [Aspergillus bombycis]
MSTEQAAVHPIASTAEYYSLGSFTRTITTKSPEAQECLNKYHNASRKAKELLNSITVTPVEQALINAIQARFPADHPTPYDFPTVDKAYANTMKEVYQCFGDDDLDVATLYADALMHTALRKMFHVQSGLPIAGSPIHDVRAVFDLEMSATPTAALPAADRLRHLVPDAGHMHHMPTHLDVLVGDYRRSIDSNTAAVHADEKYLAKNGAKNFYSFYCLHNYHSLVYAAMLAGQSTAALRALDQMESSLTDDVLRVKTPPLADWLGFFKAVRVHVYIRFGLWGEIKNLPLPDDQDLYCVTTTMTHYGKGMAWAATGNLPEADKERELYHAAVKRVPPTRKDFPNLISDVLKVATAMLDGEIEYRRGNYDRAFEPLREAIHHDDSLMYTEPWGVDASHAPYVCGFDAGARSCGRGRYCLCVGFGIG